MTRSANPLEQFFTEALLLSRHVVTQSTDAFDFHVSISNQAIALRFANAAFAEQILPALHHLKTQPVKTPDLTVYLWDMTLSGRVLPPPPWDQLKFFERGNLRGYRDGRYTLIFDRRTGVFSGIDSQERFGVYWTREAGTLPYYERSAPLRHLFQGWLQQKQAFITHASAVGRPDGGVILAGVTGSGKSTTAVISLKAGLRYAGDDYALTTIHPTPYIFSLYNSAKLNAHTLEWVPEFRAQVSNADRLDVEKALLFLSPAFPQKLISGFPLKAIILPKVTHHSETQIQPLAPKSVFMSIVPDTVFTALGDARLVFQTYRKLVYQIPGYRLLLGTDLEQIPQAINRILDDPHLGFRPT